MEQGKNCIITAPTGSGKTEAAVLPILQRILDSENGTGIKLVYITPLRALNRDMIKRLEDFCKELGVSIAVRHGDTQSSERQKQARKSPSVLITTPETLQSILPTKTIRPSLKSVNAVIVDEIHELYNSKRGAQLSIALERLEELAPGFQRIGISATIGDTETVSRFLCNKRQCTVVSSATKKNIKISIEMPSKYSGRNQALMERMGLDKESMTRLESIAGHIKHSKSTLLFGNTRQVVEALGSRLINLNQAEDFGGIGVHHGSLDRKERIDIEDKFKSGAIKSIIATSSLELGIDIGRIDLVIQYGSPHQSSRMMQRIGRSGHSESGVAKGVIVALNPVDAIEAISLAENAKEGKNEKFKVREGALDVLANQICGIALDKSQTSLDEIQKIIERSYVYRNTTKEETKEVIEYLNKQRLVGFDGSIVSSGGRTRMYYYNHLSVIPDTKRFIVKSMADNRIISSLDEGFVSSSVEEGTVFITKGLPWKVISIDERVISVEPSSDLEAAVPDWSGEDIPVARQTAQKFTELLSEHAGHGSAEIDSDTKETIEEFRREQRASFLPRKSSLAIEEGKDYKALHTMLGTLGNEALSRIIAYRATAVLGRSISIKATPYMIFLELPSSTDIMKILKDIKPQHVERLLEEAVTETEIFRYRFITVAKLFGVIERDATVSKSIATRLIKVLNSTPVYKETVRELLKDYFDTEAVREFFDGLSSGKINAERFAASSMSPLSKTILNAAYFTRELMMPLLPKDEVLESFTKFMLSKKTKILCTYCGFNFTRELAELSEKQRIECPSCSSPMLCPCTDEYQNIVRKRKEVKKLTRTEDRQYDEMMKQASLFDSYGGRAAVALATYGVGPTNAARVLMMLRRQDRLFYLDLIEAQRNFIRTKKYWSI